MAAPLVMNVAKGAVAYYGRLLATNDALIAIPLELTGIESDDTLQDYDTVAALLAGATNEQTTMGRKTMTGVTVTVDDTNNRVDVDAADVTWTAATGNDTSRILLAYDPDTTGGTDSDLIPLFLDVFTTDPQGGDITYQVAASGFFRAS